MAEPGAPPVAATPGAGRPTLFTIPVHRAFADALVAGIVRRHGDAPLALAAGMVLLPNQRSVLAVRDAFIRLRGGATLLPRLVAIGDVDLDDRAGSALDRIDDEPHPPVIDPVQRRFILARLIREERGDTPMVEALRLADALARAFDELAVEDIALDRLAAIRTAEDEPMAAHWEQAFDLMARLARRWPEELDRLGMIDRSRLRTRVIDRAARLWAGQGLPVPFVVAAGLSVTAPAVARLLRVIALAPGGTVVMPHLDTAMPRAQWDALGGDPANRRDGDAAPIETHPQYQLKLLLDRMGFARDEVETWPEGSVLDGPANREQALRHLLAPAAFTDDWPYLPAAERRFGGVAVQDCATPAEEALTIALAMRETLEQPERTAALVTPDRAIAARVAGHLARWGIQADDSAGQPLALTPPGALLLALAEAAACGFSPVETMALLSHPLVAQGDDRRAWLDHARRVDLALRGPRPAPGLAPIGAALRERAGDREDSAWAATARWWDALADRLAPLAAALAPGAPVAPGPVFGLLRDALALLAGDALWVGAAGRALAELFAAIERHVAELPGLIDAAEVAAVLRALMADVAVRPAQGGHPRLFIWGMIEARLQRADRMILAGLNEGQWPQLPTPDPWLPPMIRRRLGLAGLDRQTGIAAHDFAAALGAPQVIVTRSQREGTAPTVPSRLRLRMDALAGDGDALRPAGVDHRAIAAALDACAAPRPVARPQFTPPAGERPTAISVTEVDVLLADPFSYYARAGLRLFRLDPLDADPTAAWRGTAVHEVLESWLKGSDRTVAEIDRLAAALLARPGVNPLLRTLWRPRLLAPLRWAAAEMIAQAAQGRVPLLDASEAKRSVTIADDIRLTGKPDRIDRLADGRLAVVDYKTGSGPAKRAVDARFALQLGLLGAIAEHGAFTGGAAERVSLFEYWRMNRHKGSFGWIDPPFLKKDPRVTADNFTQSAWERAEVAIAAYLGGDAPFVARLVPHYALYSDFDQLMRLEEWYGQEGAA
jgi:ATP-dependent helicase/nuclease subunit B